MTKAPLPFRESKNGGSVYYGPHALRSLLAPKPPSIVERATDWWAAHTWPLVVFCVVVIAAIAFAFVVNL